MVGLGDRKLIRAWLAVVPLVLGSWALCQDSVVAELLERSQQQQNSRREAEADRKLADQIKADQRAVASQLTAKWRSATKEERAMTSEPRAPGAAAVYLYTEYKRDDAQNREM